MMKKLTQLDLRFCKNEGSQRSKNNEKLGQQDKKNQGENCYKMLQNIQMTDLGEKLDQL